MTTPRNADGEKLCAWCGGPVPPSLGTKPRAYCKDGCVQRAYEARKLERQLAEARGAVRAEEAGKRANRLIKAYAKGRSEEAELRAGKSREVPRSDGGNSREVPNPQVGTPAPAPGVARPTVEECPYCRRVVVGLVAHLRQCPEGPDTAG